MYLPYWNLTQHSNAREWCSHVFPPTTLESLKLLSHSHMANHLQYTTVQVAPYLVVATSCLRYLGANLAELVAVKTECDELREKVWLLKDEKHKFEELCTLQFSAHKVYWQLLRILLDYQY